jgi:hypothetical protein
MTTEKSPILALNLNKEFPRSPRETLGGYVIAARTLDKCRAAVAGTLGEYHFDCPLDNIFFSYTGIKGDDFKAVVATGTDDAGVAEWIEKNAKPHTKHEIIQWNNTYRDMRLSEMPIELQEFLEGYIPKYIPKNRPVYRWFDVYDIEEGRI